MDVMFQSSTRQKTVATQRLIAFSQCLTQFQSSTRQKTVATQDSEKLQRSSTIVSILYEAKNRCNLLEYFGYKFEMESFNPLRGKKPLQQSQQLGSAIT